MKFKANLSVPHTQLLYNLINPLSKLQSPASSANNSHSVSSSSSPSSTILYLDDDKLVLSTRGSSHKNDSEGIFCFAELITTDGVFTSHVIDSLENDNAILMEISLLQFKTALKGVLATQKEANGAMVASHEVSIKLAKRNGGVPHLCFDIRDPFTYSANNSNHGHGHGNGNGNGNGNGSNDGIGIGVNYAIPVRIMRVDELQYHVPPRLGMPDVQLGLPRDRPIRNVVERLRGIAPHLYIEGSMRGILTLRIDSDGASIRTSFDKLIPIHEDCKSSQSRARARSQEEIEPTEQGQGQGGTTTTTAATQQRSQTQKEHVKCTLKVDSKKLHACLHWQATLGIRDISSAVLCMFENEMLVLDVTLNPEIGRFMYYMPVHYISTDDMDATFD